MVNYRKLNLSNYYTDKTDWNDVCVEEYKGH